MRRGANDWSASKVSPNLSCRTLSGEETYLEVYSVTESAECTKKWFTGEGTSFYYLSGRPVKPSYKTQPTFFKRLPLKNSFECIALKACFLMQTLLLQKPFAKSKAKGHVSHLQRRLAS